MKMANNETTVNIYMDANHTLQAIFRPQKYHNLTIVSDGNGTTTGYTLGSHLIAENQTVQVTAVPDQSYQFTGWLLDDIPYSQNLTTTVQMYSNIPYKRFLVHTTGLFPQKTLQVHTMTMNGKL
jgi:hypothetical protein